MALTSNSDVKTGDKVTVSAFTGKVDLARGTRDGALPIVDDQGNVSYMFRTALTKVLPYTDGAVYLDSSGESGIRYTFRSATQDWLSNAGNVRALGYPTRPLRQVILGSELND
jgi:hypothetical protein